MSCLGGPGSHSLEFASAQSSPLLRPQHAAFAKLASTNTIVKSILAACCASSPATPVDGDQGAREQQDPQAQSQIQVEKTTESDKMAPQVGVATAATEHPIRGPNIKHYAALQLSFEAAGGSEAGWLC